MKKHEKGQYFRNFIVFLKDPHPFDICHLIFAIETRPSGNALPMTNDKYQMTNSSCLQLSKY
jgi:hypothetical protein